MGDDRIRFALVGCGRIGQRHAEQIARVGLLQAVCDIDRQKADDIGDKYNCNIYYSIGELLAGEKELGVVCICTPNGLHAGHSIEALNAGLDVLCEKPMAIKVHDCVDMIVASRKNKKRLFVVKQNRFNPPVAAVKETIKKGLLGKIYSVQLNCFWNRGDEYYKSSWKGTKDLDGGTLFTQFSHFIDLLYWMIGDVKKVHALTANFAHKESIGFEDTGVATFEFESGALGTINFTVNSHHKNMEGSFTIFAEKGTVKIGGQYLNELEYQDIEGFEIKGLSKGNGANDYGTYVGSMSNHDKVYDNVVDVIKKGATMSTNSFDGLKTVEIIEKIYSAAKKYNEEL